MSYQRRSLLYTVVVLVALLLIDCAEAFEPKVSESELPNAPKNIVYFNDSSIILYHADGQGQLFRSEDDGSSWKEVKVDGPVNSLIPHPFDDNRAFAITTGKKHYTTVDKGKTWKEFEIPHITGLHVVPFAFHAEEPDYILLSAMVCPNDDIASPKCTPKYFYTTDSFQSSKELVDAHDCQFARSAKGFESGEKDTIVCMINPRDNTLGSVISERRLAISHDFFKSRDYVKLDSDNDENEITGVVGFGAISKFFLCTVATSSENHRTGDAVKLIVSKDLEKWEQVRFSDERSISENAYTVLESSDTSLHVDVLTDPESSTGTFYTSNSDGTYFIKSLEHTNRNRLGLVDMEKIEGIDGVLIANVVDNPSAGHGEPRRVRSKISYDDGRNWNYLHTDFCKGDEGCGLNVHSVVDHRNIGRIFSSPAPGIIAGIGNIGKELTDYNDGELYISRDSGLNWHKARPHAALYEFGDHGNVVVAADEGTPESIAYSLDGESWQDVKLKHNLRPKFLFTTPDSTSLKFVLVGQSTDHQRKFVSVAIDLTGVYDKKCEFKSDGSGDFEKWYARYNPKGEPNCLMGHKQYFWRKKANAKCYVGDLYHEQHASQENCKCVAYDYECDERFMRQKDACVPTPEYAKELSNCKEGTKYKRPSGYRLIPGNTCDKKDGLVLDAEVEVECGKDGLYFSNGNITHQSFELDGTIRDYFYLKAENGDSDETIILRNNHHQVFVTHDQGGEWEQVFKDEEFIGMYPHPHFPNNVYLITPQGKIYYSEDRAHSFNSFQVPASLNTIGMPLFSFHPKHPDWLLYVGEEGCSNPFSPNCKLTTYYTQDNGRKWNKLQEDCKQCRFVGGLKEPTDDNLIFCTKGYVQGGETKLKLVSSTNFFTEETTHFDDVIGYAHEQEFVVAATVDSKDERSLVAMVSVDGKNFAEAKFPHNFNVDKQQAYTVLESVTNSVFLHVTVSARPGSEYGSILKSNSNGTQYVVSLENVNRDEQGFVDFEKMQGLEGVAIVNSVENPKEVHQGSRKKLKTKITHNDGAEWEYLRAPKKDSEGKDVSCNPSDLKTCSLNLHGYTERLDYRDTFSSQSAIGLMIGVGNVGEYLTPYQEGNTYLTRDGGVTWQEIKKGSFMWEFGDSGSVVVIVNGKEPTNRVFYSLDEGKSWKEYQFSDDLVKVDDIATLPSDTSRKFLLLGRQPAKKGEKSFTIQVDFTGLTDRQCVLDPEDPSMSDFELWTPSHPLMEDNCLFGHEAQYHRKIPGKNCYIGRSDMNKPHKVIKNCTCTRRDFECDFNYQRVNDGTCKLVPGYSPPDHSSVCDEFPDAVEYWEPTGYRRIPLSTCQGGQELDHVVSYPCPGKEDEYKKKHRGLHGLGLFFVIVLPIGMTGVIGYIVWDHYSKRYGQIRLGEEEDDQPAVIQYAIISVAAIVAVASVVPSFFKSVYSHIEYAIRSRTGRYTSRNAFVRGRQRYTAVDAEDEGELLRGDSSDDDIMADSDDEL